MTEQEYGKKVTSGIVGNPAAEGTAYSAYRIPGIVVSQAGTVIVYWECRFYDRNRKGDGNSDECQMDLAIRRSTDGGVSFGQPIMIAKGEDYYRAGYGETVNNPVMIVGQDGKLHLLFCCDVGAGGIWYTYSNDDAVTWSRPINLVDSLRRHEWKKLGLGPGHGICLKNGRLIVPAWLWNPGKEADAVFFPTKVTTIYSDDNGENWQMGEIASSNRDETCIVELSDGRVMLNSRQYTFPYCEDHPPRTDEEAYRMVTVSPNGIDGWSDSVPDKALMDPACAGSICSAELEGFPRVILFSNCASKTKRFHLTVRCSPDNAASWLNDSLELSRIGWYSDIAVDEQTGKVYVLHENGAVPGYEKMCMELFTFRFSDCFDIHSQSDLYK